MDISIADGQTLDASDHFNAEGSDHIIVTIPPNSVETTVDVQPSLLEQIQAIFIRVNSPAVGGYASLTFKVDEIVTVRTLDGPLMLIGPGNIGLLGATINQLKFTNAHATIAKEVEIFIARTAIVEGS